MATMINKTPSGLSLDIMIDMESREDDKSDVIPISQTKLTQLTDDKCSIVWAGDSENPILISTTICVVKVSGVTAVDDTDLFTKLKALY